MNMDICSAPGFSLISPSSEILEDNETGEEEAIDYVTVGLDEVDSDSETLDGDDGVNEEQLTDYINNKFSESYKLNRIANYEVDNFTESNYSKLLDNLKEKNRLNKNYVNPVNDALEDDEVTLDVLDTGIASDNFSNLSTHFKLQVHNEIKTEEATDVMYFETDFKDMVVKSDVLYENTNQKDQVLLLEEDIQYGTLMSDGSITLPSGVILGAKKPLRKEGVDGKKNKDNYYGCTICFKMFTRKSYLQAHHNVHLKNSRYVCNSCGKNFSQLVHLRDHVRIHKGERPYACPSCEKQFTRISDLKRHQLMHLGYKLHACDICGKQLSSKHGLQYHLRVHKGIRPFPCTQCEKRFAQRSAMSAHMKTHYCTISQSGERKRGPRHSMTNSRNSITDLVPDESVQEFGCVEEIVKDEENFSDGFVDEIQEEIEI